MPKLTNPTDIARETLKLLATRRILPTPDNYQKIYAEIAGLPPSEGGGDLESAMKRSFQNLSKRGGEAKKAAGAAMRALDARDWAGLEAAMGLLAGGNAEEAGEASWAEVIKELIRQWEVKQRGVTSLRKREGLEQVLINFGSDPGALRSKLRALARSWGELPAQAGIPVDEEGSAAVSTKTDGAGAAGRPLPQDGSLAEHLRELLAQSLELGVIPRLTQFPDLVDEAGMLARRAREASDPLTLEGLSKGLKQFWFKLELRGESDVDALAGVIRLLSLLVENISELVADDQWLKGQIAVVQNIISGPINPRSIFEAERSFKEVIFKQGNLKKSLNEAKSTLKNMIVSFIDRLGEMADTTSGYHGKIEGYAVQLSQTEDIHHLNQILDSLLADTRGMQLDVLRSRDELLRNREEAEAAERRIRELQVELEQVSEKVREDQLTGTLNRRGLEDAFQRELARSDRTGSPVTVAVLDLDNFKRLNDTYGHQAGDEALIHLTRVVRDTLRPTDVIARFGGEEFVIILPDTDAEEGVKVMTRVQRNLTKRFFLHKNEKLLITFSAGVAQRAPDEAAEAVIARADQAMYQAKQAGRNRVIQG